MNQVIGSMRINSVTAWVPVMGPVVRPVLRQQESLLSPFLLTMGRLLRASLIHHLFAQTPA